MTEQTGHLKHRSSVISEISICCRKIMTKKKVRRTLETMKKRERQSDMEGRPAEGD